MASYWQQYRYEQQRIASAKRKNLAKILNEIDEVKKKISLKERCSQTILNQFVKQVDDNGRLISSLSEGNFELRKTYSRKFSSDFEIFCEKFYYRPKTELLAFRGKTMKEIVAGYKDQIGYLRNHLDKLRYLKKIKREDLDKLQAQLITVPFDEKAYEIEIERRVKVENNLDKLLQKIQLAKQIRGLYLKIRQQLKDDFVSFPKTLSNLQKQKKAIDDEMETLKFYQEFATKEHEDSMKKKMALEAKVRQEKKACSESIAALERKIRLSKPNEDMTRPSDQLPKKNYTVRKTPLKSFQSIRSANKDDLALNLIADYEAKSNMLKNATGISFWNSKKMAWCLANQQTINENLQKQVQDKKSKISERTAEKEMLNTELEKLNYERDTSYEEIVESQKEKLKNLQENVLVLRQLIYNKASIMDKSHQSFEYLVEFLLRKILHYKLNILVPMAVDCNTDEEKLFCSLTMLTSILSSLSEQAEKMLSRSPIKATEILLKTAVQSPYNAEVESGNNRITWRPMLEIKPSEADYDFQGPDNNEYVSRKKLKRRAEQAVRGTRRKAL